MNKSETIGELVAALAKAQGEMDYAKKDAKNPYYNSRYADLASCWAAARKPLAENGLAVIQTTSVSTAGVVVETTLAHSSGEWITSELLMPVDKMNPQAVGSAITYGRRYALAAIVGVVTDDDDGEAAMDRQGAKDVQPQTKPTTQPTKSAAESDEKKKLIWELQHKLRSNETGLGLSTSGIKQFVAEILGKEVSGYSELSIVELKRLIGEAELEIARFLGDTGDVEEGEAV